jgi:ATP-dependent Clp protease ATP-binding subunit ClpC
MDSLPLSPAAQALMSKAAEESTRLGHRFLGVEHLFAALSTSGDTSLRRAFASHNIALDDFVARLFDGSEALEHTPWGSEVLVTPRCQEVLHLATRIATRARKSLVTDEHILQSIFEEGRSVPMRLLRSRKVPLADLYEAILPKPAEPASELPLLERFGRNLTALARDGGLMPVIGREREIGLVIEVLLRKRKNSPVLVGEAGVGKTAVVEGLAQTLLREDARHPLRNSLIIELSTAALVAGTKYRGEFEERMLGVLKEASGDPRVVLFLDEIHTLVGAGVAAGDSVGASEIIKPALARGELRCIGATTIAEYRRYIERDAALERRFEPVLVEEPTVGEARAILAGLSPSLAAHHGVTIAPQALEAALDLTVRYVPGRQLPDKAIDAIDQSCARARLKAISTRGVSSPTVGVDAVATTVSQWTGIPLERLSGEDAQHLLRLEDDLSRSVFGQNHACRAVAKAIMTAKAGLADPDRPTGVFLFMGPTGVGKTELARSLARLLFGDEKRLIRFDMSEYMEPHSVAKLIGAPPGYVGHEQEGLLVSAVRTHPDCVVLFDEIEKAHPQVFDLFLQIFDDGRLTDAHGKRADFRNAVIVLTSNLQFREAELPTPLGFKSEPPPPQAPVDLRFALSHYLRPELVNRIDEIILFHPLGTDTLRLIIDRHVASLAKLAHGHPRIELAAPVYDFLIAHGASDHFGAREMRRAIDRHLRQPLAEELLRHGDGAEVIRVGLTGDRVSFEVA